MSYSQYDYDDTQTADANHAQSLRNSDLTDDLKCRLAAAVRQWLYCNDIELSDPMWGGFAKRSQECLEQVVIGKLMDTATDACSDYLPEAL